MYNSSVVDTLAEPPTRGVSTILQLVFERSRSLPVGNAVTAGLLAVLVLLTLYASVSRKRSAGKVLKADDIPILRGIPLFGHWRFFDDRYAFINEGMKKLGSVFQFNVLNHKIVAISGEQARKTFLTSAVLHFRQGYHVLHGSAPDVREIQLKADNARDTAWFSKHVLALLRKDRLEQLLPRLLRDVEEDMKQWGTAGQFDALDDIYRIVFRLTARAASCDEIASSSATLARLSQLFHASEKATSATTVVMPWFPSRDRRVKSAATKEMFQMLATILRERRQSVANEGGGNKSDSQQYDAMSVLMEEGCDDMDIIQFIMTTMFAGIVNTGIMSAWLIMYLGVNQEWKARVIDEIRSIISKYANPSDNAESDTSTANLNTLASRLSNVPPSVWEDEMPITELCLRETIRLVQSSVFLRRNVSNEPFVIDGHHIEPGSFVVYPTADVHHNPAIYPEPEKWDPTRFLRDEDKTQSHAFLGWGAGRHPCIGMRFAKLEVKCIMAMFLTGYDCDVVDKSGAKVSTLPTPNRNNLFERARRPGGQPIFVKYQLKHSN